MILLKQVRTLKVESIIASDIYKDVFISLPERKQYSSDNGILTVPVFFYRIIGIEQNNETEYLNALFNLDLELSKSNFYYSRIDYRLNIKVTDESIQKFNEIWDEIHASTNLRSEFIIKNLFGSGIIPNTRQPALNQLVISAFQNCLESFITSMTRTKNASIIKNFCIKLIHWFRHYAYENFVSCNFIENNPKVLFYGDVKRDEIFFMILLSMLGFDVVYFNSLSDSPFNDKDAPTNQSIKLEFSDKLPLMPFPIEERIASFETMAFQAERSAENLLSSQSFSIIKPWQFENYDVKSVPLKTTYEEMFLLWNTESRYRAGFKANKRTVFIPNIFAKINGTHKNKDDYWTDILRLVTDNSVFVINKIPFSKPYDKSLVPTNYLNSLGFFDLDKIKNCKDYNLSFLKLSIQETLMQKINEIIQKACFTFKIDESIKSKIITTLFCLNKEILKLLQKFDYPFTVPKIFIYQDSNTHFSKEDYITLALLNLVGLDIVIFTPTGYSNIENGMKKELLDVHSLSDMSFDLKYPKEVKQEFALHQEKVDSSVLDTLFGWLK